jgi:hypothetical protein
MVSRPTTRGSGTRWARFNLSPPAPAQNDDGLFELSFRDERYLPFEGAGAICQLHLQMPAGVAAFDYSTIFRRDPALEIHGSRHWCGILLELKQRVKSWSSHANSDSDVDQFFKLLEF